MNNLVQVSVTIANNFLFETYNLKTYIKGNTYTYLKREVF